jgi:hypothetical protein
VKIGTTTLVYYDPSYGVIYDSPEDFKTKAVAGIFVASSVSESDLNMDLNNDGVLSTNRVETAWFIREPDAGDTFKVDTE